MIADTIDNRPFAESVKPFTRELWTGITMTDVMCFNTITKSVFALPATLSDII